MGPAYTQYLRTLPRSSIPDDRAKGDLDLGSSTLRTPPILQRSHVRIPGLPLPHMSFAVLHKFIMGPGMLVLINLARVCAYVTTFLYHFSTKSCFYITAY